MKRYINDFKVEFYLSASLTTFSDDLISRQNYFWRSFFCPTLDMLSGLSKADKRGVRKLPLLGGETTHDWIRIAGIKLETGLEVKIPYQETDSIAVWRDLYPSITENLTPLLPLPEKIRRPRKKETAYAMIIQKMTQSEYMEVSLGVLTQYGLPRSPLWTRYIHHLSRQVGKISTSASKIYQVLLHYDLLPRDSSGFVITLAEGSGGILNFLSHMYYRAQVIFNTLQGDEVEVKDNILNLIPPSIIGDRCQLVERLVGLESMCLGETDISKPEFVDKLNKLLLEYDLPVLIMTMDAELKTDMNNMDKLKIYLPLMKDELAKDGLLINKMFLREPGDFNKVKELCDELGYRCNFHKPRLTASSRYMTSSAPLRSLTVSTSGLEGEYCSDLWELRQEAHSKWFTNKQDATEVPTYLQDGAT
ncbi:hypothetical protein O0L34_g10070 [Tuta absoluta]|nr:hypothetical protein O0L34_g10070 [Tuta absoluta]